MKWVGLAWVRVQREGKPQCVIQAASWMLAFNLDLLLLDRLKTIIGEWCYPFKITELRISIQLNRIGEVFIVKVYNKQDECQRTPQTPFLMEQLPTLPQEGT